MKKVFLSIIGILFLSCSFYDETKALSFHSDCYLAFKGWLKEGGSEKLNQAFIETVDGKSIYRFDFSEEAALSGYKQSGHITLLGFFVSNSFPHLMHLLVYIIKKFPFLALALLFHRNH